ncbi:YdcH family protein [Shimia gijangensis]|nr:YdcH family protein [Shimia gijangensis]
MNNNTEVKMSDSLFKRIAIIVIHMKSLKNRQTILDGQIEVEHKRRAPDQEQLRWLKVRRLMVRDQIARYESILQDLRSLLPTTHSRKVALA